VWLVRRCEGGSEWDLSLSQLQLCGLECRAGITANVVQIIDVQEASDPRVLGAEHELETVGLVLAVGPVVRNEEVVPLRAVRVGGLQSMGSMSQS